MVMKRVKNPIINRRAATILFIFLLLFLILFSRFFYIELTKQVNGHDINVLAEKIWTDTKTIEAQRGTIYDRKGNVIAQDIPSYTIYAIVDESYPNHVKDPKQTASLLAPILDLPQEEIEDKLVKGKEEGRFQVEFGSHGRKLTQGKKSEIDELNLDGIGFVRQSKRYYPNQTFASHIIGFTNENDEQHSQVGIMGLEKSLNDHLTEKNGKVTFKRDQSGVKLPVPDEEIEKPKHGQHVYLTIDENIQMFVEQALDEVVETYNPERAIAIVVNPKTGEVLGLSNRPSFNPNKRDVTNYSNDAISSRFEPGSTMKIFTLAAAIEEGVYNGNETFQSGRYKVYSDTVSDHNNGQGWGTITFDEGVRRSSNVAFSILARDKIGTERFYQYLVDFGFDQPTGIDLPDEVNSAIRYDAEIEKVTTSFGQGTAVTPIQQVQAATAIANDGVMMQPHVIQKIVDPESNETIKENTPKIAGEPISSETAEKVLDILETVVEDGTGRSFAIEGYQIAGKTGTAQIPSPEGGYMKGWGNNIYSFIGFAPKDDPELIVYTAVDRPKLELYELGSQATSMLFKAITQNSLQYLNIKPDESKAFQDDSNGNDEMGFTLEDYSGQSITEVRETLEDNGLQVEILGDENQTVMKQIPFPGSTLLQGERVVLRSEGNVSLPDLTGWSLADAMKIINLMNLDYEITGTGYVRNQSIQANEQIREGDLLELELAPPNGE